VLTLESVAGQGTKARVMLPVAEAALAEAA